MALSFTAYLFADPSPTLPNLGKFLKGQQLLHAWTGDLCRQWTGVSLAKLSAVLGLEHPHSSSNLVRLAKRRAEESLEYQKTITLLETKLALKTENQV